ncbi:unnamed protein product [Bursaphelenchus xylophilus]|uniref:(pine wood nematode) hypothetical protein n=1 Tax=Bursaphelenchus xylophilus TaxID=6326 RepID=A0A1I7S3X7_BURXY|nr:unnamed protein product [Bursaphelenchus xylophilus]CAG9116549.1 unnamed protein product [Bursaphelenchus xylophilus]
MTERRLLALDCPSISNLDDESGLQKLIRHLEENVFRLCYGRGRNFLYTDIDEFMAQLPNYLDGLKCPKDITNGSRPALIDWVLDAAIEKAYDIENADQINALNVEKIQIKSTEIHEMEKHLKESVHLGNPEFREKLKGVLTSLGLQKVDHKDTGLLLKALLFYSECILHNGKTKIVDTTLLNLDELSQMDEDKQVDHAMKILNLLNVKQIRDLQTKINELIVRIQEVTADPKTDIKLRKVGQ